jgi:dihydrodipicolinate synthase/N-acetylneuraminate lyase
MTEIKARAADLQHQITVALRAGNTPKAERLSEELQPLMAKIAAEQKSG